MIDTERKRGHGKRIVSGGLRRKGARKIRKAEK